MLVDLVDLRQKKPLPRNAECVKSRFSGCVQKADGKPLTFTITDATVDRDGDVIDPEGGDVKQYLANPIVLFMHDRYSPPIAKTVSLKLEDGAWKAVPEFTSKDQNPFGFEVGLQVEAGFLSGASIGFVPEPDGYEQDEEREGPWGPGLNIHKWTLLEWSLCTLQSNPAAHVDARSFNPVKLLERSKAAGLPLDGWVQMATRVLDRELGPGKWATREQWEKMYAAAKGPKTVSLPPAPTAEPQTEIATIKDAKRALRKLFR